MKIFLIPLGAKCKMTNYKILNPKQIQMNKLEIQNKILKVWKI
jgi:hypothetical protein